MLDVRTLRSHPTFCLIALSLCALSPVASEQDKSDTSHQVQTKDGVTPSSPKKPGHYVKLEGKVRCEKPETEHAIDVPDRPGHVLIIAQRRCNWTEPMKILGAETENGVAVSFTEKMEGVLHTHTFEVDTLDNGEKLTMQANGQILGEKGPATAKSRWNFMRGTGKFKGIKGAGTCEGKLDADDVLTLEFDGVYDPSEIVAEKK